MLAVSPAEIIAVEVKSEKDTLDLLESQVAGMQRVAHVSIAAVHERFVEMKESNRHYYEVERDGKYYLRTLDAVKYPTECWIFPEVRGPQVRSWQNPREHYGKVLPLGAINMIWKEELIDICNQHGISVTTRSTCDDMRKAILWHTSGAEWTKAVCGALRRRNCPEADPPMAPSVRRPVT